MFLSKEELIQLTGYKQPSKQRSWLDRQGIRYYLTIDSRPVVSKDAFTQKHAQTKTIEPRWTTS